MYVVTVDFTVQPQHIEAFRARMLENARASLTQEPGCRQFDVCVDPGVPATIFLYELYVDRAAFDAHLAAPHFLAFAAAVAPWVAAKVVRTYQRVE
jgi:quinol monooxygenase YgiN